MNPNEMSQEILSEIERDKIIQFCADPIMREAVKKYLLAVVYKHGVLEKGKEYNANINWAMQLSWKASDGSGMPRSDEELGQDLRALTKATQLVGSGFKEMEEMKKPEVVEAETINPSE